ncbi:MAG: hypothetical protein ACFCU3_02295 [Verrucomicrobiales bacterium]
MKKTEQGLIFDWDTKPQGKGYLGLMFWVAVLGHLGAFLLFQVVYPQPLVQFPSDARIELLSPNFLSEDAMRWVNSHDPANVFQPVYIDEDEAPEDLIDRLLVYEPSFAQGQAELLVVESRMIPFELPSIRAPAAWLPPQEKVPPKTPTLSDTPELVLTWLAGWAPREPVALTEDPSSDPGDYMILWTARGLPLVLPMQGQVGNLSVLSGLRHSSEPAEPRWSRVRLERVRDLLLESPE